MKTTPKKKKRLSGRVSSPLADSLVNRLSNPTKKDKPIDVTLLSSPLTPMVVRDVLSTGLPNVDHMLCESEDSRWGLPVGRIISIKAKPRVGKTTLVLRIAEQAYKRGGAVHIVESEHALDKGYMKKLCTDPNRFLISQPDTLEEAFDTIDVAVGLCANVRKNLKSDAPFVIIVDSFSGFMTEGEREGDFSTGGKALGGHARIASLACRKLTGPIAKAKAILILTHQVKSKIGVFWGNPETNIGGEAFNFHDSICLNLYANAAIKNKDKRVLGHFGTIRTTKNKLYPPFMQAKFKLINGRGFQRNFSIFEFLLESKVLVKKGSVYHFREDKDLKWKGMDNFAEFIKSSSEARKLVRKYLNGQ